MDELVFYAMHIAHSASSYTSMLKTQVYTPLRQYATSQPDLLNIALLLVIVYLSLSILSMATRWIYAILITTVRLLFVTLVVVAGIWVWQRGPLQSQSDFLSLMEMVGEGVSSRTAAAKGRSEFNPPGRYEY